jgi:hypothetical protein
MPELALTEGPSEGDMRAYTSPLILMQQKCWARPDPGSTSSLADTFPQLYRFTVFAHKTLSSQVQKLHYSPKAEKHT